MASSPTAEEALAWAEANGLTEYIEAEVAKAPPLPPRALVLIEAMARQARQVPTEEVDHAQT